LPLTIAAIACASRNTLSVPLNRIVPQCRLLVCQSSSTSITVPPTSSMNEV
jgi:hypothetical protein